MLQSQTICPSIKVTQALALSDNVAISLCQHHLSAEPIKADHSNVHVVSTSTQYHSAKAHLDHINIVPDTKFHFLQCSI